MEQADSRRRWWLVPIGALVGLVLGAILSVNVVIFGGAPDGYQTSIPDLFAYSPILGTVALGLLVAFPVAGAILGFRRS